MILVIDLCWKENSLSRPEFVDPIVNIAQLSGEEVRIVHHLSEDLKIPEDFKGIILCGTALKDNGFRENKRLFDIIKNTELPILGICAGMQAVAFAYRAKLAESYETGMDEIRIIKDDEVLGEQRTIQAYELHGMRMVPDENFVVLAESEKGPEAVRHIDAPVWGVLFHPEVRNEWIVSNFVRYCCR